MNYRPRINLRLSARNEGKIKAHGSCCDVRAWSHELEERDRYLREWIKNDMTVGFISVPVLANLLKIMTRKSRGKAAPQCHPDCKSKIVLESICASCEAMKGCLRADGDAQKYLEEEEFETSHWPCDKCLDALKNIKLFWKILIGRVFGLSLCTNGEHIVYSQSDNVRSISKEWKEEMVEQALFVKSFKPVLNHAPFLKNNLGPRESPGDHAVIHIRDDKSIIYLKPANGSKKRFRTIATDTNCLTSPLVGKTRKASVYREYPDMVDVACETSHRETENEELKKYKKNLVELEQRFCTQKDELNKLKTENSSLKLELQRLYKKWSCKCAFYSNKSTSKHKDLTPIPKPFETCIDENIERNFAKDVDSEMVITMKNCKDETYRHISLLQVLHKSNGPMLTDVRPCEKSCRNEDPINLLNRVKNTFGEIVKREMDIACESTQRRKVDINATFHKMCTSSSAPSCTSASESDYCVTSSVVKKN